MHTIELGRSLRRVSEHAVSSLAEGFEAAQRISIRAEESMRRTFLDDLLDRHPDPVRLGELATRLGFPSFSTVLVAVAGAERDVDDGGAIHRRVRVDLQSRAPDRHLVITAKDGRLVVIAVDTTADDLGALLSNAVRTVHSGDAGGAGSDVVWQIGIGDAVTALEDVGTSYRQGVEAMRLGRTFALDIGSRTVAYRLERISDLTGYSARNPEDRFILELAYRAVPLMAVR